MESLPTTKSHCNHFSIIPAQNGSPQNVPHWKMHRPKSQPLSPSSTERDTRFVRENEVEFKNYVKRGSLTVRHHLFTREHKPTKTHLQWRSFLEKTSKQTLERSLVFEPSKKMSHRQVTVNARYYNVGKKVQIIYMYIIKKRLIQRTAASPSAKTNRHTDK